MGRFPADSRVDSFVKSNLHHCHKLKGGENCPIKNFCIKSTSFDVKKLDSLQ
jgi:hypothetical protein